MKHILSTEYCSIIDPCTKLKQSFQKIFENYENLYEFQIIDFQEFYIKFQENDIILTPDTSYYEVKNNINNDIVLKYTDIPKEKQNNFLEVLTELEKTKYSSNETYAQVSIKEKNQKDISQKLFDEFLWPLVEKKGFIQNFSQLRPKTQEDITKTKENFERFLKKVNLVSTLFETHLVLDIDCYGIEQMLSISYYTRNKIILENSKSIKKFLDKEKIPGLHKFLITPQGNVQKETFIETIDIYPSPTTAHEKLKLKKEFLRDLQ